MGRSRNLPSDLLRQTAGGGVRSARLSEKDTADKQARHNAGENPSRKAASAEIDDQPLLRERFDSVWDALGFSPEESASLEARSELMIQIREKIRDSKWTQAVAAKRCGVSQPRINDLLRGRIDKFSLDALVNMAAALGQRVVVTLEAA